MDNICSWIYRENINNIWKFSRNTNKELQYSIMDIEKGCTKEIIIDKDVLEFTIFIEEDIIHIVYINIENKLKYCIMKDHKWVKTELYSIEGKDIKIYDLKMKIIQEEMHIFYLLKKDDTGDCSILTHCLWTGKEKEITQIHHHKGFKFKEEYKLVVDKNDNIDLFFITNIENRFSMNYNSFRNHKWSLTEILYEMQADNLSFEVLKIEDNIHILKSYEENQIYSLIHIFIKENGDIRVFKIHKSNKKLSKPLILFKNRKIYSSWVENRKIFYSIFNNEAWGIPSYFNRGNEDTVKKYGFYAKGYNEENFKDREVYGTNDLDLNLFIPSEFVIEEDPLTIQNSQDYMKHINEDEKKEINSSLKAEIYEMKMEVKKLEDIIEYLNKQLHDKEEIIKEYEETVVKISNQKRKSDENCIVYMKLQDEMKKEMKELNQELAEEIEVNLSLKDKLKEAEEENENINKELRLEKSKTFIEYLLKKN